MDLPTKQYLQNFAPQELASLDFSRPSLAGNLRAQCAKIWGRYRLPQCGSRNSAKLATVIYWSDCSNHVVTMSRILLLHYASIIRSVWSVSEVFSLFFRHRVGMAADSCKPGDREGKMLHSKPFATVGNRLFWWKIRLWSSDDNRITSRTEKLLEVLGCGIRTLAHFWPPSSRRQTRWKGWRIDVSRLADPTNTRSRSPQDFVDLRCDRCETDTNHRFCTRRKMESRSSHPESWRTILRSFEEIPPSGYIDIHFRNDCDHSGPILCTSPVRTAVRNCRSSCPIPGTLNQLCDRRDCTRNKRFCYYDYAGVQSSKERHSCPRLCTSCWSTPLCWPSDRSRIRTYKVPNFACCLCRNRNRTFHSPDSGRKVSPWGWLWSPAMTLCRIVCHHYCWCHANYCHPATLRGYLDCRSPSATWRRPALCGNSPGCVRGTLRPGGEAYPCGTDLSHIRIVLDNPGNNVVCNRFPADFRFHPFDVCAETPRRCSPPFRRLWGTRWSRWISILVRPSWCCCSRRRWMTSWQCRRVRSNWLGSHSEQSGLLVKLWLHSIGPGGGIDQN